MARARNIKPGFFRNEDLAECSAWARLCFAGLWTLADREGRLEDRPKRIKGDLFSYDSVEVSPLLEELQRFGFIRRYVVENRGYIQIINFHKHQNPHHKEPQSEIPPEQNPGFCHHAISKEPEVLPPCNEQKAPDKPQTRPRLKGDESVKHGGQTVLNPESGFLIPDSLSPIPPASAASRFDDFWKTWPKSERKQDKAKCFEKWKKSKLDQFADVILEDIALKIHTEKWRGGYIESPLVYLNGRRWEDGEDAEEPSKEVFV